MRMVITDVKFRTDDSVEETFIFRSVLRAMINRYVIFRLRGRFVCRKEKPDSPLRSYSKPVLECKTQL